MTNALRDKVAVAGVGHSGCFKTADVPLGTLAVRACREAILDAGLEPKDIDGICTIGDEYFEKGPHNPGSLYMIESLGLPGVRWWGSMLGGGVGVSIMAEAAVAVATGQCQAALAFRAMGAPRPGQTYNYMGGPQARGVSAFLLPYGHGLFAQQFAAWYQRYRHEYGTTDEQLGMHVVTCRENALRNDKAVMDKSLSMEEYLATPWIAEPLRRVDCDMPVDGCAAVVVTTAERARDLPHKPVYIGAAATGQGPRPDFVFWDDYTRMATRFACERIWDEAGMSPSDMDFAMLYDGFSPLVFYWLEDLSFVSRGEAGDFVGRGELRMDGSLPSNTNGGNLSEGRLHGMGLVVEGVLQLQGRAGPRQVPDARAGVITGGATLMAGVAVLHT